MGHRHKYKMENYKTTRRKHRRNINDFSAQGDNFLDIRPRCDPRKKYLINDTLLELNTFAL